MLGNMDGTKFASIVEVVEKNYEEFIDQVANDYRIIIRDLLILC